MRSAQSLLVGVAVVVVAFAARHSAQATQLALGGHDTSYELQVIIPHSEGLPTSDGRINSDSASFDFATTTIDILSSSPNHSIFIHLLQRTKLIPTLNLIPESTIFAPVDEAWRKWSEEEDGKDLKVFLSMEGRQDNQDELVADNILFHLRQHLLYHILNYTLTVPIEFQPSPFITTESTLLFPSREIMHPSPAPPPNSPWLPQGGTGSLGGKGQKVRVEFEGDGVIAVGGKASGEEGVEIWNEWMKKDEDEDVEDGDGENVVSKKRKKMGGARMATNGAVVGLMDVLRMPRDMNYIIQTHSNLTYLASLLSTPPASILSSPEPVSLTNFTSSPHLTLFAPVSSAFETRFDKLERRYLESEFGQEGLERIIRAHVVEDARRVKAVEELRNAKQQEQVGWRDSWSTKPGENASAEVLTLDDRLLSVQLDPAAQTMTVNSTSVIEPDVFASNGVIHIVDDILLPSEFRLLNSAEKVLLTLNATRFVSLLREANLSDIYVGTDQREGWTILAPSDDVLENLDPWDGRYEILTRPDDRDGVDLKLADVMRYHVLPGKLKPKDFKDGVLLPTELKTKKLGGGRQKIKVEVGRIHGEQAGTDGKISDGAVRLGGTTVLTEPIESGESIIYLISSLLEPPIDVVQTAVSDLGLSTFIASTFAASLNKFVQRAPAITYFIPTNKAFAKMGLTMNYLLTPEGNDDLRKLVRYHAVEGVHYMDDITRNEAAYKTATGGSLMIRRNVTHHDNGTDTPGEITLHAPARDLPASNTSVPSNGESNAAHVLYGDMLTDTGVIHVIDSVKVPPSVDITLGKLVKGSGRGGTMAELLRKAGMQWLLEGREPEIEELEMIGLAKTWRQTEKKRTNDTNTIRECENTTLTVLAPAYVLLVPTDTAFANLNLSFYMENRAALISMLKLHVIPSQQRITTEPTDAFSHAVPSPGSSEPHVPPPREGHPLTLSDEVTYRTLLSDESKYGDLAIRGNGDNGWLVGVRDARGTMGQTDVARVISGGRGTPRWACQPLLLHTWESQDEDQADDDDHAKYSPDDQDEIPPSHLFFAGTMSLGGGIFLLDNVLLPYEPSWFMKWGWLILTLGFVGLLSIGLGLVGWWWWRGRKSALEEDGVGGYEPLEGEEND